MFKFNINNYIYFKPTKYACELFKEHHKDSSSFINKSLELVVDEKGFSKLQGWKFMQVFGESLHFGGKPIIECCEIYIEEDYLEKVNV